MRKKNIVVRVELAEDDERSSITPGWEVIIEVGNLFFSYDGSMCGADLSKAEATRIGQAVARRIGAEFKLIE